MSDLTPKSLPVPPDFPIDWGPNEDQLFWEMDRVHFMGPIPVLVQDFMEFVNEGFGQAAADFEMPIRWKKKYIHNFDYTAVVPAVPMEDMEAQTMRALEKFGKGIYSLQQDWSQTYLPEVKAMLEFWESFDLEGAEMPALLDHFQTTLDHYERLWHIHFLTVFPVYFTISQFDELYTDLFGEENALNVYQLLQGFDNKTLEADRALWTLSQKVLSNSELKNLFETKSVPDIVELVRNHSVDQTFLEDFERFQETYGQRANGWWLHEISWIEDPSPAIQTIKDYVQAPPSNPKEEMETLSEKRDRLIEKTKEALQGYPQPVKDEFESMLPAAQYANVLSEDHGYWIDFRSNYKIRCVIMEMGKRFCAAGVLDSPQDVFHLHCDQIKEISQSWPPGDEQKIGQKNKTSFEKSLSITPPPVVGSLPPGPPPNDPISRTFGKFFGLPVSDEPPTPDTKLLQGHPGSSGKVVGTAKVILSLKDADKLKEGDILVTATTAPPWTPLFATAAAVVTDAGGVLCHCAVVAREYGIPAVVGTMHATSIIQDGQTLEIDGDSGQVKIV